MQHSRSESCVAIDKRQIEEMLTARNEAAYRARVERARGQISLADGFDRLVAQWDLLLAFYGVKPGNDN